MKIGLVSVYVSSPLDAFKYYTEVLGFVKKMYVPEALLAIVASPEDPNGTSLLLEPNDNPIATTYQAALHKAGIPVIVFTASDIYAEYEKLKTKGVIFKKEPIKTEYGIEALFEDTFGNLIQLYQA